MGRRALGIGAIAALLTVVPAIVGGARGGRDGSVARLALPPAAIHLPFCAEIRARTRPTATATPPECVTTPGPGTGTATTVGSGTPPATATAAPLSLGIAGLECGGRDEIVWLANQGVTEGDMAGWQVRSIEGDQIYTFAERRLAPGETVALHSGPDAPPTRGQDVRWSLSYIWNNADDRAQLLSPTGLVAQEEDCRPAAGVGP